MFDTNITICGTVLTQPEKRFTTKTNALVTSFRVVSNARRYDRENQQWVDGANLRIKVNCWRRLAEGVLASINVGDPVIVYGRIATRDWKTEQGEARISFEVEAENVGHDLSRGQAQFRKTKVDGAASVVEDSDSEHRVHGELTESFPTLRTGSEDEEIVHDDGGSYDEFPYGEAHASASAEDTEREAMAILRGAGLDPAGDENGSEEDADEEAMAGAAPGSGGSGGRSRRRGRQPVPA
jgi:single-strand DNA-binding protein